MGTAVSLILIAVGAVLTWAVTDTTDAVDLSVVGVILMGVGLVGLVLDLLLWSSWGPAYARRRTGAARPAAPAARPARRTVVEEEEVVEGDAPPPAP
jgi:hypothetical protein